MTVAAASPDSVVSADANPLAEFTSDLDQELRFRHVRVRLGPGVVAWVDEDGAARRLALTRDLTLERAELTGVVEIRLVSAGQRQATFYATRAVLPALLRFESKLREATSQAAVSEPLALGEPEPGQAPVGTDPDEALEAAGIAELRAPLMRLFAFARPHTKLVALGFGLTLATTLVGLIPPYLTMPLVDQILVPHQVQGDAAGDFGDVIHYLVLLGGAAAVAWLLAWGQGAVLAIVGERVGADLRNRTFAHLLSLGLDYFGGKRTGDLVTRIGSDTDRVCRFLADSLTDFITDVLMVTATCVVLLLLDPVLGATAMVSFPPIAWVTVKLRSRLRQGFLRGGRVWSAMTSVLADAIPGIRVVKAFGQEPREVERFAEANRRIVQVNNRVNALWTFFWPLIAFLNHIGLLVVWAVGAWLVLRHQVTVGVLTAFIAYIGRFYARIESMSRMLAATQRAAAAAQRLFEILDRTPSVANSEAPVRLGQVRGEVEFSDVTFRYGDRIVLHDVSFRAEPGTMIGIVGHTGSGKSTIANLLCRFYDVISGSVRLDGIDIRRFELTDYRSRIGIVLQDPFLFFGTVADNVAYGRADAPFEKVLEATRAAMAHDFVLRLPEAYDTIVGERGQSLSGGERQRIAIARAILVDPALLILDEATSAVDPETERDIQRAIDNLVQGRTTIAIAHRLSTLRAASQLIVLRAGRLVETGTHDQLLAKDGEYARLHRAHARVVGDTVVAAEPGGLAPTTAPNSAAVGAPFGSERETATRWLAADEHLSSAAADRLLLQASHGQPATSVVPRRCFPLSDPARWVSLVDEQGREVALIRELAALDPGSRSAVERALARSEFMPQITRLLELRAEPTRSAWSVETDRGACDFVVVQEENIRALGQDRVLIVDQHGVRYLIPTIAGLDRGSQRLLGRVL